MVKLVNAIFVVLACHLPVPDRLCLCSKPGNAVDELASSCCLPLMVTLLPYPYFQDGRGADRDGVQAVPEGLGVPPLPGRHPPGHQVRLHPVGS